MQIEFMGCTSAGKSSMVKRILRSHPELPQLISHGNDFVLQRMRLAWVVNPKLRVIALNMTALWMCLLAWRKYRPILSHAIICIRQLKVDVSALERLRIFRITLRNVGLHEFVERYAAAKEVVITDEGMLQIAHYLFVHIAVGPRQEQIETFGKLVPLPDAVVYIRQPAVLLVQRTLQRGHKRIPNGSTELAMRFVTYANTVFEVLIQQPAISDTLVVIDNGQLVSRDLNLARNSVLVRVRDLVQLGLSTAD